MERKMGVMRRECLRSFHLICLLLVNVLFPTVSKAQPESWSGGRTTIEMGKLEDLIMVHERTCLPRTGMTQEEMTKHYSENAVSEQCYRYLMEIEQLEKEVGKQEGRLEQALGCEGGQCQDMKLPVADLSAQLSDMGKVGERLSCDEMTKGKVKNTCGDDVKCALLSSSMLIGGGLVEKLLPKNLKMDGCHYGNDSCATQLATAFLKGALSFFEGAWDLLKSGVKAGGRFVKKKAKKFWNWVSGADDHASTAQLTMAKASEDEGVFQMLRKDFIGTMGKIFGGLIGAIKEWLKNDVFCQEWEGTPQFSKCKQPMESFDCLSCKTMINGFCSMAGTFMVEIVPSFLTGGLLTAAKQGASGAAKLAKLLKVSDKTREAIKASRVAKLVSKAGDVLKINKGLAGGKLAAHLSLKLVKTHIASPARAAVKRAHAVLTSLSQKGKVFLVETKTGKALAFSGRALKKVGKAVVYPIDNPMTTWAFKKGETSFAKLFKLGPPRLAAMTPVASAMVKANPGAEKALVKLETARAASKPSPKKILKLEEDLVKAVKPKRVETLDKILSDGHTGLPEIIRELYPELQYGKLAQKLGKDGTLAVEKEILEHIGKLPPGPHKEKLLHQLEQHTTHGLAREKIVGPHQLAGHASRLPREGASLPAMGKSPVKPEEATVPYNAVQTRPYDASFDPVQTRPYDSSFDEFAGDSKIITVKEGPAAPQPSPGSESLKPVGEATVPYNAVQTRPYDSSFDEFMGESKMISITDPNLTPLSQFRGESKIIQVENYDPKAIPKKSQVAFAPSKNYQVFDGGKPLPPMENSFPDVEVKYETLSSRPASGSDIPGPKVKEAVESKSDFSLQVSDYQSSQSREGMSLTGISRKQNSLEIKGKFGECCSSPFEKDGALVERTLNKVISNPTENPNFVGAIRNADGKLVKFEGNLKNYQHELPEGHLKIDFKKEYPGLDEYSLPVFDVNKAGKLTEESRLEALAYIKRNFPRADDFEINFLAEGGFNAVFKACPKEGGMCKVIKIPVLDAGASKSLERGMKELGEVELKLQEVSKKMSNIKDVTPELAEEMHELAALEKKLKKDIAADREKIQSALESYRMDLSLGALADDMTSLKKGPKLDGKDFLHHAAIDRSPELLKKGLVVQDYYGLKFPKDVDTIRQKVEAVRSFIPEGSPDQLIIRFFAPDKISADVRTLNEFMKLCRKATIIAVILYCDGMKIANNLPELDEFNRLLQGTLKFYNDTTVPVGRFGQVTFGKTRGNPAFILKPEVKEGVIHGEMVYRPVGFDPLGGSNLFFDVNTGKIMMIDR